MKNLQFPNRLIIIFILIGLCCGNLQSKDTDFDMIDFKRTENVVPKVATEKAFLTNFKILGFKQIVHNRFSLNVLHFFKNATSENIDLSKSTLKSEKKDVREIIQLQFYLIVAFGIAPTFK